MATQNAAEAAERYVCFRLAGQEFAIPIGDVKETIRPRPVTPVFHTPPFVLGLVNLRGEASQPTDLPVGGRDSADGLEIVERLVDRLRAVADGPVLGIGVGTPGVIDSRSGTIFTRKNSRGQWCKKGVGKAVVAKY